MRETLEDDTMTYKTHFVGGACAAVITSAVMPIENIAVVGAISAVSALLPDIDIKGSKVNNKAGIVGKGVSAVFSHRGFIHTPILYVVLYFLMSMVLPMSICQGFLVGTLSHLVLDTFNSKGIMWLYPITRKHFHVAKIKTRGVGETVFMFAMIAFAVVAFVKGQKIISFENVNILNNLSFNKPSFDGFSVISKFKETFEFISFDSIKENGASIIHNGKVFLNNLKFI